MARIDGFKQLVTKVTQSKGRVNLQGNLAQLADGTPLGRQIGKVSKTGNRAYRLEQDALHTVITGVNRNGEIISINHITESPQFILHNGESGIKEYYKLWFERGGNATRLTQGNRMPKNCNNGIIEETGYRANIIPRMLGRYQPDLDYLPPSCNSALYMSSRFANCTTKPTFKYVVANSDITKNITGSGGFKQLI